MQYWLMKSEPDVFSIDDLKKVKYEPWDGVRNYQARNFIKSMKQGDLAFFYHSNCSIPGIVGIMEIIREAYPDKTAFDQTSKYFDAKNDPNNPRWFVVDVKIKKKFSKIISLQEMKEDEDLKDLPLVKKGNRLSIMPLTSQHWKHIISL